MTEHGDIGGQHRNTRQRGAVGTLLSELEEFRSAQELHALLRARGERVGLTTVYRTLQALANAGEVDVMRPPEGEQLFRQCSRGHHHHLVCRTCGVVADVDCAVGEAPCLTASDDQGFSIGEAEVVYWGLCPGCSAAAGF